MPGDDGHKKVSGPMPTLFAGIGPCAQQTLAELSRLTQSLTTPIPGPFGLLLVDPRGEEFFTCDWPDAAAWRVPEPAARREASELVGADDETLRASLASLVRRLRAVESGTDPAPAGHVRVNAYVALDLAETTTVAWALRLLRTLRQVDAAADVTILGLTGRTAATSAADDKDSGSPAFGDPGRWFETWKRLLEQLQDGPFAQRLYLLDGCDTDKTWLEYPDQLQRLGAEFLFYHGITCRGPLRQNERARTGTNETLLNVCGSFGCRTLDADLSTVAQRVAQRLAREDLAGLYQRTIPSGWLSSLQDQARLLVDRIATIGERAARACPSSAGPLERVRACHGHGGQGERNPSGEGRSQANAEIAEAIRHTVKHVCTREPLLSLCFFFQFLRPRLARLLSQQQLWERARTRHLVARIFRQQEESTYEPLRLWLSRPQTRWLDRFTPAPQEIPEVVVSRPAAMNNYLLGGLVLVIGLAGVALGVASHLRLMAVVGGWISLAAAVLMALPAGWTRYPRHRLREGQDVQSSVRPVAYRKRASRQVRRCCAALLVAGLAGITWPWWPNAWAPLGEIGAVVLAVLTVAGAILLAQGPTQTRPDQVRDAQGDRSPLGTLSEAEAPGHAKPPVRWYRGAGWLCLAGAWAVFCLGTPLPAAPDTVLWVPSGAIAPVGALARVILLTGLVLTAVGTGWALFPRVGHVYLIDRMAKMPQPLTGGIGRPVKERQVPPGVATLAAWLNHLSLDPEQCLEKLETGGRKSELGELETANSKLRPSHSSLSTPPSLFDFVATDWEGQLAQAFRREVEVRSGKPLRTLALQPVLWAECILHQLEVGGRKSEAGGPAISNFSLHPSNSQAELTSLFALQAVTAWVESHTLAELLSFLALDLARFGHLVGRLACAHWPSPRFDPDMNTSVLAVGKPLWEALAPLSGTRGAPAGPGPSPSSAGSEPAPPGRSPAVVLLDWDSDADRIVVLRVVQGLAQGWRGFPGLLGQRKEEKEKCAVGSLILGG